MEVQELRQRIMEVLEYDPETGLFRWKEGTAIKSRKGWFSVPLNSDGQRKLHINGTTCSAKRIAWIIGYGKWPRSNISMRDKNAGLKLSNLFETDTTPIGDESVSDLRKRLMDVVEYDASTGLFRWKGVYRRNQSKGWFSGNPDSYGYIKIKIFNVPYAAHRLAWLFVYCKFPEMKTDHENGVRTDNRILNLRDVSALENNRNKRISKNNTTGATGVVFSSRSGKFTATIKVNGKRIHLGSFSLKEEAIATRKAAEKKYGFHQNHGRSK